MLGYDCWFSAAEALRVPHREGLGEDRFVRRWVSGAAVPRYCKPIPRSTAERDLPGSLLDAGDLTLVRQLTEADTADAVIAEVGVGTAADLAAVVAAAGELGLALSLQDHRFLSHTVLPPLSRWW